MVPRINTVPLELGEVEVIWWRNFIISKQTWVSKITSFTLTVADIMVKIPVSQVSTWYHKYPLRTVTGKNIRERRVSNQLAIMLESDFMARHVNGAV